MFSSSVKYAVGAIFACAVSTSVLAQSVLSPSDTRRLEYYSAQALTALTEFQPSNDQANRTAQTATLRQKILRLLDAGQRSGASVDETAAIFQRIVEADGRAIAPDLLFGDGAEFDAKAVIVLFTQMTYATPEQRMTQEELDQIDIDALQSIAVAVATQPASIDVEIPVVAEVATSSGPVIPSDASPAIKAVLNRVQHNNDRWEITVIPGDSLSLYAQALYGDRIQFTKIFEANTDVMLTPNALEVGVVLVLPKNL